MSTLIPIFEGMALGFKRDMVVFHLAARNVSNLQCKAIIDTGCPVSFIPEVIARRTRLPCTKSSSSGGVFKLGPFSLEMKKIGNSQITFLDNGNNPIKFEHEMYIGVHQNRNHATESIPAFLGKDFIDKNKLSIIYMAEMGKNILRKTN